MVTIRSNFRNVIIKTTPFIIDGGMGTELQRRGVETKLPLWSAVANFDHLKLVQKIHEDYFCAGARMVITNTFRTQQYVYDKVGQKELADKSTRRAFRAAQNALSCPDFSDLVFLAGGMAPLEDCYRPDLVPPDDVLLKEHSHHAKLLDKLGVDVIFCETANCIREAKMMLKAADPTGCPLFISLVCNPNGTLLSGESLKDAIKAVREFELAGILLNCRPVEVIDKNIDILLKESGEVPTGAYANGEGQPDDQLGWKFDNTPAAIDKYVEYFLRWVDKGLNMAGGCCGTTPEYIKALKKRLPPPKPIY